MPRRDYYSATTATSAAVVKQGVAKLAQVASNLKATTTWIITPAKSNLDGHIKSVIGEAAADALSKNRPIKLTDTCSLRLYTEKTLPFTGDGSPILLCYPGKPLLNKVDGLRNVPALIVLPWTMNDIQPFIDAHSPEEIFTGAQTPTVAIANPVVERALISLSRSINKSTGISHPSDKDRAIDTFRILRQASEAYTPEEIRAWLVRNGIEAGHADKIAEIAANPLKFRSKSRARLQSDILEQWREAAKGEDPDV